ncbi:MAG: hypothetical protein GX473_03645 [Candidatus Fermentibacter daniensis]|nr:hypothetical protein [Candidatus Fermentibacter daniensis]
MLVSPQELRRRILTDEFDFRTIMSVLEEYSHPRDRITRLLEQGVILQIRRGLYIFAEPFAKHPLSRELLANLVHGPSYVSMESALEYHAMIPERTKAVTSASFSRGRSFVTPVGLFIYQRVPERVFSIGVERVEIPGGRSFLMARPEKALADMVHIDRGLELRSFRAVEEYLYDNLRIDPASIEALDASLMESISAAYGTGRTGKLAAFLAKCIPEAAQV